mgnify:CR=1 FL=1
MTCDVPGTSILWVETALFFLVSYSYSVLPRPNSESHLRNTRLSRDGSLTLWELHICNHVAGVTCFVVAVHGCESGPALWGHLDGRPRG